MITADFYPTRKENEGRFLPRIEPVSYGEAPVNYAKNGYCVIKEFFSQGDIRKLKEAKYEGLNTQDPKTGQIRSVTGFHEKEPFNEIASDAELIDGARKILGSDIYIHQSRINYKLGLGSNGWHWHSDFETWHSQDGMPGMRCLTAMIPLTSNTNVNGSLMVIPGSHKVFYSCKKMPTASAQENFADQKEGVPDEIAMREFFKDKDAVMILCEPGDLVLFDCNLIHGSVPNITMSPRTNVFFVYNSIENKLIKPYGGSPPRPEEMGARINTKTL